MTQNNGLTRRQFLKSSAVTAAAVGVGSVGVFTESSGATIGPDEVINAAFIGTGSQGCYDLDRACKVPNVKFVACCDIQEKNLAKGLGIAKGADGYKDYREVIARKDVQAILIATPICLHAPIAIEALKAGKHVFSEKMMAYTIEDAKRMMRASQDSGKKLQIGHQRRYDVSYQHAYNLVKQGALGKITHVRAQWNRNGSWRRPCPDPKLEELINWRLYRKSSHGLMAELGSHQIDVVNWMLGETPSSVVGVGGLDYYKDGRNVLDNVQLIYEYPSGVKFTYQSLTTNQYDGFTEQFMGDKGTLIIYPDKALLFPEPKAEQLAWADAAHTETENGKKAIVLDASKSPRLAHAVTEGTEVGGAKTKGKDDYYLEMEDFFLSLRDGHEPLCNARVALDTCIASIKGNEAMDSKKRMVMPPELYKC